MSSIPLLLWLALVPVAAPVVSEAGIRVTRAGEARSQAQPGSVSTVAFRLANLEDARRIVAMTASLPLGWTVISAATEVNLASRTSELQLLTFAIPRNTRPGIYTVRYGTANDGTLRAEAVDSVLIEVGRRAAVDIQFMAAPAHVRGSTTFTASFALRNQGNTPVSLSLRATAAGALSARPDFEGVSIEPDNTFYLNVRVTSPKQVAREIHTRVTLTAVERRQNIEVNATSTLVRILPTVHERSGGAGQLPLRLAARLNSSERVTPSVELSGEGPMIAGTDMRLELIARTPTRSNGLSEDRDQLYLGLGSQRFNARFGDQFVALTPLTELGRPGFGTMINLNAGPIIAGALAARDRRGQGSDLHGGKLGIRIGSMGSVTGNYIAKVDDNAQLLSVRAVLAPARFAHGEIEFAGNAIGENANAHIIRFGGSLPWATYDVRSVRNSPEFRGSGAGVSSDAAVLRLRPVRRLEFGGAFTRSERADHRSAQSPSVETYRAFASFGSFIGIEGEQRDWLQSNGELSSRTETLRARSTFKTAFLTWQPAVELTDIGNQLATTSTTMKYTLRTALNVKRQSVAIALVRTTSDRPENAYGSEFVTAALQIFGGTRLDVDFQQDRYAGAWKTTLLNAAVDQRFFHDHHIAARTRLVAFNGQLVRDQSVVTLEYILPLNINMPRSRLARVDGVVIDATSNRPVRDALVRLDDRTVITGSNGRFSFRDVEPQTHYLQLELSAVGANLTTLTPNPMILDLSKSAGRDIRIAVTRAARVRGFIRTRADASADEERLAMFLRNAIVELSQGSDAHRRTVDGTGEFSFDGLRPGTWQLRVVNELPTDYAFADHTIQKLDLKAGEAREVTLELQRKDRPLRLMKEKELPTVQLESH